MITEIDVLDPIEIEDAPTIVHVGVPMMDEQEARACVTRIKTRIDVARGELLELKDREGWKALGYSSWGACARAEFGGSAATLYRQLEAAEIARSMGDSQFENLPTSHLQAVKQLEPEQRVEAIKRADVIRGDSPRTVAHVQQAAQEITAPAPDLTDILLRLDAHGYAKSSTRQKGMTTFYSFRDYSGRSDETGGEIELAEGELPLWLSELDSARDYAQAKQEKYLDAQARAERLGYDLKRDGARFALTPAGQKAPALAGTLDQLIKTIEGYEKNAAKKVATAELLPSEDEQHRITIKAILKEAADRGERTGTRLYQQAYDHAREIHDVDLYNKMIALIDRATDTSIAPPPAPAAPTLAELDVMLPADLHKAGYFWVNATPPTIAHNVGNWTGDAQTIERAIEVARDREKAKGKVAAMETALKQAQHMIGLLEHKNWSGARHVCGILCRTLEIEVVA